MAIRPLYVPWIYFSKCGVITLEVLNYAEVGSTGSVSLVLCFSFFYEKFSTPHFSGEENKNIL